MLAQGAVALVWFAGRLVGTRHALSLRETLRILGFYVAANVLTIFLYLPWLPKALHQITTWPSTGQPIPAGEAFETILGWFMLGINYKSVPKYGELIAVGLVAGIVGLLLWFIFPSPSEKRNGRLWRGTLPILWLIVPIGTFMIIGLFRPANLKLLLPSQIGFALCMAMGLSRFWQGFRSFGFGGTLLENSATRSSVFFSRFIAIGVGAYLIYRQAMSIPPLYTDRAYQRADYRSMVAAITADPRPGDAIILDAPNQEEVFRYYYKGDAPMYPLPPGLGGNDAETAAMVQDIIAHHDRIFVLFWGETERDPEHVVEGMLDTETFQAGIDQWYGDVRFAEYVASADMPTLTPSGAHFGDFITLKGYALSAATLQPGDVLQVRLDWQTDAPLATPYKVFLQLLNSDGILVAQRDSEPGGGSQPTTAWKPGETLTDLHGLTIPSDLPSGEYQLIVGLYNRDDPSARLPVREDDYLELATITIGG
jgi:hypothetical protein